MRGASAGTIFWPRASTTSEVAGSAPSALAGVGSALSAGFGSGGYTVYRYFENEDTARCRTRGVDDPDKSWINGQWWGRESRSGEGLFLDRRSDGTTFFAWFTHRPKS